MEQKPELQLLAVRTNAGLLIKDACYNGYGTPVFVAYLFDGKAPEKTFHQQWYKLDKEPKQIKKSVKQPHANRRFELIDEKFASDKIPKVIPAHEDSWDSGLQRHFMGDYDDLYSLYEFKSDPQPDKFIDVAFSITVLMEIDNYKEYAGLSYPVQKGTWAHEGTMLLTSNAIQHQLIDQIVFPEVILPSRPSALSSEDSYKIVRQHVKDNINPKYAEITSDYDFCFTVKKKIPHDEIKEEYTVKEGSKRKPREVKKVRYINNRQIIAFEMTHATKPWQNYPVLKGFSGKNHEDLKKNIDAFLKELMEKINEPVVECKCCQGRGVVLESEAK